MLGGEEWAGMAALGEIDNCAWQGLDPDLQGGVAVVPYIAVQRCDDARSVFVEGCLQAAEQLPTGRVPSQPLGGITLPPRPCCARSLISTQIHQQ
jgi:hypothetical protein